MQLMLRGAGVRVVDWFPHSNGVSVRSRMYQELRESISGLTAAEIRLPRSSSRKITIVREGLCRQRSARSPRQHKAWGGAKRNPRITSGTINLARGVGDSPFKETRLNVS